jgi:putative peptidoglycan lipid II flippase
VAVEASAEPKGSLARGAAAISAATVVSRITGFLRVLVVAYALGGTFLANTYQTANTAPNVLFELVAAGVLTSVFVPTFVEYLVKDRHEEGWEAANVLTSLALVILIGLAIVLALAAPLVMRVLTLGVENQELRSDEIALGTTFLRLFAPQVVFYGVGMIMTGALHAYRKFAVPAIAPIFNNVVVIGVYLAYAAMRGDKPPSVGGVSTGETLLLGLGTTLGVVAMTVALAPQLFRLGWRYRWSFRPKHPSVRKASRLGVWALGYAGGYQAGLIVVLLLANKISGGVAAYQWAYTFFFVPHALFAAPIFHVLFPALSEHKARSEEEGFSDRLRSGMAMLLFILVPVGALMAITSQAIAGLTLEYGVMTQADAALVGRVIAAFCVGLPAYSAFTVYTRAFYALGDPRTPTLVNFGSVAIASAAGAVLFFALPVAWAVPSLAIGHSLGFVLGTLVLGFVLSRRTSEAGKRDLRAALVRVAIGGASATGAMLAVAAAIPEESRFGAAVEIAATSLTGGVVYVGLMGLMGSPELGRVLDLAGKRRWRAAARVPGRTLEVLPPSAGGIAIHVAQLVSGLDGKDDLDVEVAGPSDLPVVMPKDVAELHIPTGPIAGHRRAIKRIRLLLKEGGYSTVHAHGLRAGIDTAIAARGSRVRVILTVHNLVQPEIAGGVKSRLYSRAETLAVRLANHTFAASQQIADHLRERVPSARDRIEVLHVPIGSPPVVERDRNAVRADLELGPEQKLLVTAARLAPQKALHVMLEAFAKLGGNHVLAIVGEGPLEEDLRALAGRLGIDARVRWVGFREDVADFVAAGDVFVLSSVWEAVALAAQEAVLLGVPVVSTDVGGMRELITDQVSGRLVPKGDADALADALEDVIGAPDGGQEMARRALEHYRTRFSREAMLERLEEEYTSADDDE